MKTGKVKTYLRIMRPDHWIKQFFVFPGVGFAFFLVPEARLHLLVATVAAGIFSTCLIASPTVVINN